MPNQSRNKRLLCLKRIFEEETDAEHGLSMPGIMKHLRSYGVEADRRTLYEDIRVLQALEGMDIEHGEGERIYRLRSRTFSIAELKLIVDSMASSKVLSAETTKELTVKLESLCSKYEREYLRKQVFLDSRIKSQNKKIPLYVKTLNEGIIKQRWVAFRHFRYDLNKKKVYYLGGKHRRVRPAALLVINDIYYLLGYDKHDHRKLYRLDRISHVVIHSESFEAPPAKLTSQLSRLAFMESNPYFTHPVEAQPITMRFHNYLVDEVLDKFGFAIQLIPEGNYSFKTTVMVEPTSEFFGWIMSLGTRAEIIEPESMRNTMKYRAWSEYRKYNNSRRK